MIPGGFYEALSTQILGAVGYLIRCLAVAHLVAPITFLLVHSEIAAPLRDAAVNLGVVPIPLLRRKLALGEKLHALLSCDFCTSFWISGAVLCSWVRPDGDLSSLLALWAGAWWMAAFLCALLSLIWTKDGR